MKILTIFLLIKLGSSICVQGCLKCKENNNGQPNSECQICDASSLYVLVDNSCFKQNLQFCLLSFNIDQCALCMEGYYLEMNNKCVSNPTGINSISKCKFYQTYHYCSMCEKNYYLSETKQECLLVENKVQNCEIYNSKGMCAICYYGQIGEDGKHCEKIEQEDEKCLFYYDQPQCKECQENYEFNENYFLSDLTNLFPSVSYALRRFTQTYQQSLNLPRCQKISQILNCQENDTINNECFKCKQGYYISDDKKTCIGNPDQNSKYKAVVIPYCNEVQTIIEVVNNIPQTKYRCKICYEGYYLTISKAKCNKHSSTILNCQIMSQEVENQCLKCQTGYYRSDIVGSNEKCHKRGENPNCKEVMELSNECKVCIDSTYIKHYNNTICSKPINGCETYNTNDYNLTCKYCQKNFYYDTNSKKCLPNVGSDFDPYCSLYNSEKLCLLCLQGYYFNKVSKKCEPNGFEYFEKSKCEDYTYDQKNTCDKCQTEYLQIEIIQTCKLYPNNFIDEISNADLKTAAQNMVSKCGTFEMNSKFEMICKEVYNKTTAERQTLNCQQNPTINDCKMNYLDLNDNSIKEIDPSSATYSDQVKYCEQFEQETSNAIVICEKCYDDYTNYNKVFTTDNNCDSPEKMPWCNSNQRFGIYSTCALPIQNCGKAKYSVIGTTEYDTCDTSICSGNVQSILQPDNSTLYYCPYPNALGTSQNNICSQVEYKRDVKYELVKTYENKCVINDIYTLTQCILIADSICKICIQNYYPVQYEVFPFLKDSVDSYTAHESKISVDHENLFQCIVYDSKDKKCRRCGTGYKLSSSTKCIPCDSAGKVSDYQDLFCLVYGFGDVDNKGVCIQATEKQSSGSKLNYCLNCHSDNVNVFVVGFQDFDQSLEGNAANLDYQQIYDQIYYLIDDTGEISNVGRTVKQWFTPYCKIIDNNIFYSDIDLAKYNKNCSWGYGEQTEFFCLACKFGFYGEYGVTQGGKSYIQGCVEDSNCNKLSQYFIEDPWLRNLITCHKCSNDEFLPTVFFYFEKFVKIQTQLYWIFNQPADGIKKTTLCMTRQTDLVPKQCLIQIKVSSTDLKTLLLNKYNETTKTPYKFYKEYGNKTDDEYTQYDSTNITNKLQGSDPVYICGACRPGYAPYQKVTTQDIPLYFYLILEDPNPYPVDTDGYLKQAESLQNNQDTFYYPKKFIHQCLKIENCKESKTANKCDVCMEGYYRTLDDTYCQPTPNGKDKQCDVWTQDFSVCSFCKKGFVLTDKCIPYNVEGCKYYENDKCVQSKSKMGIQYSILYRSVSEEYKVESQGCAEVTNAIENCKLYGPNETCQVCNDGFILQQSEKKSCGQLILSKCLKYQYLTDKIECTLCEDNYRLEKVEAVFNDSPIQTDGCVQDNTIYPSIGCQTWRDGFCVKCTDENYYPIKVNNNQNSLCVDIQISNLCEEWDMTILGTTKQISCKRCKKMTVIQAKTIDTSLKLDEFDFINKENFEKQVSSTGAINFTTFTNTYSHARAALYKYTEPFKYCRKYIGTNNCKQYDAVNLDSTFQCVLCTDDYYLVAKQCYQRQKDYSNCFKRFIDKDECEVSGTNSDSSIVYSAFDVYVMQQSPPKYEGQLIQIQAIANCESYANIKVCEKCQKNYYLYDNLCILSSILITDCKYYKSDGICEICEDSFLLKQNKCFWVYAQNCADFVTNSKCLYCPTNYPIQGLDGSCYKNDKVTYCKNYQSLDLCYQCENNFYNYQGNCLPVGMSLIKNCELQIDGNICVKCKKNYSLDHEQKECFKNPLYDKFCSIYETKLFQCSLCEIGYYLENGKCYQCLTDSLSCMYCHPQRPSKCMICRNGFFMNSNLDCVMSTTDQNQVEIVSNQNLVNIEKLFGQDEVIRRYH